MVKIEVLIVFLALIKMICAPGLFFLPDETTAVDGNTADVNCKAGTFLAGETAYVTCYFPKNVSEEKVHLYVGWKPVHKSDVSEDRRSLACFKTSEEDFDCTVYKGFRFNNVISDRLTLEIPKVSDSFSGSYNCHQIPKSTGKSTSCDLIVNKTEEAGENRPIVNETETSTDVIIAATIAGLLVVLILFFIIMRRITQRSCRRTDSQATQHDSKMGMLLLSSRPGATLTPRPPMKSNLSKGPRFDKEALSTSVTQVPA